jgi:hypothetical protein
LASKFTGALKSLINRRETQMPSKIYVLTPGGNQVVTGQQVILDGVPQFTGNNVIPPNPQIATTGKHKQVILNGVIQNSWSSGDDFEITNLVTNNTLNASVSDSDIAATVLGIQLVNLKVGTDDVTVEGGFVTPFGGGAPVANFNGLTTLSMLGSAGGELEFGSTTNPLEVLLTNIVAQAAQVPHSAIDVRIDASLFTSPVTVHFTLNNVGQSGSAFQGDSDDYVHGSGTTFGVEYGASDGSVTATTWHLSLTGNNFITLRTHGATNTTTVNVDGTGSMTLMGEPSEFANVTTINDGAGGKQIITGALQEDGAFKSDGFLAENTALTSLNVTSTNIGNFVDLSGFDPGQIASLLAGTFHVGGGTVVFDDEVLTGLSSALNLSGIGGITNVGWGGDDGSGPGSPGTIDWSFLPSSANTLTFYHGVESFDIGSGSKDGCGESFSSDQTTTFSVINAPNTFTMNLQDEDFHGNNFVITALDTTGTNDTLNLLLGSNAGTVGVLGATGDVPDGIDHSWTTNGYANINIVLTGTDDDDISLATDPVFGGFIANQNPGGHAVIHISGALTDDDGDATDTLFFGNQLSVNISDYATNGSNASESALGVTTFGGTITDTAAVFLSLGATDAAVINAASGHGLDMEDPGTNTAANFAVTGSTGFFNVMEGTLSDLQFLGDPKFGIPSTNGNDGLFGLGGTSNITGGNQGDIIWDTAGVENITLHATNMDTIFYSQFDLNSAIDNNNEDCEFALAITDHFGAFDGNVGGGIKLTTITGFTPGTDTSGGTYLPNAIGNQDTIDFNSSSWGSGSSGYLGLVTGSLNLVDNNGGDHYANVFIIGSSGVTLQANSDLIAIGQAGGFTSANLAAQSLAGSTNAVNFATGATLGVGDSVDMLIAFNLAGGGTEIADARITNDTSSVASSTLGLEITGHALVKLVGVPLSSIEGASAGSHDVVHFTV